VCEETMSFAEGKKLSSKGAREIRVFENKMEE
jgi:hypothetical protein